MKRKYLILTILLIILFVISMSQKVLALDLNIIESARENEENSASNLSIDDATTNTDSSNTSDDSTNSIDSLSATPQRINNTTNTAVTVSNASNTSGSGVLTIDNILSILLLVVGFLLILLSIAIMIRLKK